MNRFSPTSCTEEHKRRISSAYSGLMARRLASLGSVRGWLGSPEVLKMKILSGPSSLKKSTTPWRRPVSREATVTTVVIPMTIPRMVRSERKRCPQTAPKAICMFSTALMFIVTRQDLHLLSHGGRVLQARLEDPLHL